MYPNAVEVNILCAGAACDCAANVRLEILDGVDRTTLVSVDRTNCIENRLIKALFYLQTNFPAENWIQFLDSSGGIAWNKIAISGHSQGAGLAGIIAKTYGVARSVMFAGLDYCGASARPSDWVFLTGATSASLCFGLVHQQDPIVTLPLETQFWSAFGLSRYGPEIDVDTTPASYGLSHQLVTNVTPSNTTIPTAYHGAIVADARTPLNPDGTPVLRPTWDYLLTAGTFAVVSVQRAADGTIVLQGTGLPGEMNSAQYSDTLQFWTLLGSVRSDANGNFSIQDADAAGVAKRFYRAVAP